MNDHNIAEMRKIMSEAQPMRSPTDLRLRRADRWAEAVWWIMFLACLGVLLYGMFVL